MGRKLNKWYNRWQGLQRIVANKIKKSGLVDNMYIYLQKQHKLNHKYDLPNLSDSYAGAFEFPQTPNSIPSLQPSMPCSTCQPSQSGNWWTIASLPQHHTLPSRRWILHSSSMPFSSDKTIAHFHVIIYYRSGNGHKERKGGWTAKVACRAVKSLEGQLHDRSQSW